MTPATSGNRRSFLLAHCAPLVLFAALQPLGVRGYAAPLPGTARPALGHMRGISSGASRSFGGGGLAAKGRTALCALRRNGIPPTATEATGGAPRDRAEEDEGSFAGPGMWKLEREVQCEEAVIPARFQDVYMITLHRDGTFKAAVEPREEGQPWSEYLLDARHEVHGRWRRSKRSKEVTLNLDTKTGQNSEVELSGTPVEGMKGTSVSGSVLEGQQDPMCVGSFKLTLVMRDSLEKIKETDPGLAPDDYYSSGPLDV